MGREGVTLFVKHSIAGSTVRRALKVALVVGPLLVLINQAHTILALDFGLRFFLQVALTFCVPYLVSTYSSAMTEIANRRAAARLGEGSPR
jgi:hypothetical protein